MWCYNNRYYNMFFTNKSDGCIVITINISIYTLLKFSLQLVLPKLTVTPIKIYEWSY